MELTPETFIEDFIEWMFEAPENVTLSAYGRARGIKNVYRLKDYFMTHFTGLDGTVDFQRLWEEAEKIREDKLIELGMFNKNVNSSFLLGMMKSKFNWHDSTLVVGVSPSDILDAKKKAELVEGGGKLLTAGGDEREEG